MSVTAETLSTATQPPPPMIEPPALAEPVPDDIETAGEVTVGYPRMTSRKVCVMYGDKMGIEHVSLDIGKNEVLAMIGPSGCGKSTFLRCLNRMNDTVDICRVSGSIKLDGEDIHDPRLDVVQLRARVGMVFQKPNPFPKSIYDNVAFGLRINGFRGDMDEAVETSLRKAALWDEVKDRLKASGLTLSGGQQQRLCIARAVAVQPEVILMDEPASALDPISTLAIEDLMRELKRDYTIIVVTHNMQQAARASDRTAFMTMGEDRAGYLVEVGETTQIFTNPRDERTEGYITGRFG